MAAETGTGAAGTQRRAEERECRGASVDPQVRAGSRALGIAQGALVLAYPLFVYAGLARFGARSLGIVLVLLLALRLALAWPRLRGSARAEFAAIGLQLAPVAVLAATASVFDDARFLLALPVLVNLALLSVFARSLREPTPIVERFARLSDPDLRPEEVAYCRRVTGVWCAFFAANAAATAGLALAAPLSWWALWTGLLSYAAMGLVFAAEFAVRRHRFQRFGSGPLDRLAYRWLGRPEARRDLPPASVVPPRSGRDWTEVREKGSRLGVRTVLWLCTALGRPAVRAVMRAVAAWYVLSDRNLRRVSSEFLVRVGEAPTLGAVLRHVRTFAYCASDRIFLLRGDHHLFRISRFGDEQGRKLRREKSGAIMIGAHFGSFEALRATAGYDDLPLSIVAYFENAAISNAIFENLDPELAARVIQVRPGEVGYMLEIRRRIAAGEIVAFLGDRALPGNETVEVDFLGEKARFPTGAFSVASAIGCPVLLIFGVYREPNVYEMHCEAFAERLKWPRRGGIAEKTKVVQRYAERLEHYVRLAPYNWFNFYDFWGQGEPGRLEAARAELNSLRPAEERNSE